MPADQVRTLSMYEHLTTGGQRPVEVHAEGALLEAEDVPLPASAVRKPSGWPRRAFNAGFALAGIAGCAYGASQLFGKQSPEPEKIHSVLAITEKFVTTGQEPAIIKWSKHTNKCWSLPANVENGTKLHMADCSDKPTKFIIPAGSTGPIKPAKYPDFCLDAPAKGAVLQLWACRSTDTPKENIAWLMPDERRGSIKPANDEEKCVDVPGGNMTNGVFLQQWDCTDKLRSNEGFTIQWPDDCEWEDWTNWTKCEDKCKESNKTRERKSSKTGGDECSAHKKELKECGDLSRDTIKVGDSAGSKCQLSHAFIFSICLLCASAFPTDW